MTGIDKLNQLWAESESGDTQPVQAQPAQPKPSTRKSTAQPRKQKEEKQHWPFCGDMIHELANEELKNLTAAQFGTVIRFLVEYEETGMVPDVRDYPDNETMIGWDTAKAKFDRMNRTRKARQYAVSCRPDRKR